MTSTDFATIGQAIEHYTQADTHKRKAALMLARHGSSGYQAITFGLLDQVTRRLADHYRAAFDASSDVAKESTSRRVALYANSGPEYVLTLWALMRAGFAPACLSPRNSVEAVGHLASRAEASVVVRGRESNLVAATDALLGQGAIGAVVDIVSPAELQRIIDSAQASPADASAKAEPSIDAELPDPESVALILHSSGSTGAFPKVILIPHRYVATLLQQRGGSQSDDVSYVMPPFYHALGAFTSFAILANGSTIVVPAVPSWPPTSQMVVSNIKESQSNVLCLLPWLLESMEEEAEENHDESIYELLVGMRAVTYGAAALNDRVGSALASRGVRLVNGYGSSEAGQVASNLYNRSNDPCTHWNHVQILPHVAYEMLPVKARRPNLYRLIIKKENQSLALNQANTPEGDYDMSDLLERVPCKPGRECYILRGRIDDVIVHSTGEKTSPAPIEAAVLANCHAAKSALVAGQDQFNTALLVELQPGLEPTDQGVMEEVWKAVQVANQSAPQHSRLMRQMIGLMKHGEAGGIPRTEKGSIRRKLANERFQDRIEQLYASFASSGGDHAQDAVDLQTPQEIADWLELHLVALYNSQSSGDKLTGLERDVSIFSQGFDSLLATQFYHQRLRPAFPQLKLPANLLYQRSDINQLAGRLATLLHGGMAEDSALQAERENLRQAEELYQKYLNQIDEDFGRGDRATEPYSRPDAESVVLTGCTGGLGLFLLQKLLNSPKVGRVYALVRAGGRESVTDKLAKALRSKMLDPSLAQHDHLVVWGCHLDRPKLGLSDEQWDELTHHATSVIHNAWLLNFEASTAEFEDSCIKPSYELMRLCSARTLKQFVFVSSIAASLRSANADGIIEERPIDDQRKASGMGYGQSKLLTERLAKQCAARFGVPVTIARVGQIAGDSVNGSWNTSEHVSLMIKAIETLGAMPDHYANVDFLPVDVVAATISTLLTDVRPPASDGDGQSESSPNLRVSHLVNPIMLRWIDFLKIFQAPEFHLDFDIVDAREWLRRLEESEADPVANPIKKLQGYFVDMYSAEAELEETKDKDKKGRSHEVMFETDHTTKLMPAMRYRLDPGFWLKVIRYWRSIGFLRTPLA